MNIQTSSRLKRTPPIGAPNATPTPAAEAAESICTKIRPHFFTLKQQIAVHQISLVQLGKSNIFNILDSDAHSFVVEFNVSNQSSIHAEQSAVLTRTSSNIL